MGRKRLRRYSEVAALPNFVNVGLLRREPFEIDRRWDSSFLEKKQKLVLELGCGRGEYTLALAGRFPLKNFIGMDIKGDRLCLGARRALSGGLSNALFVRARIEHVAEFFCNELVSEIWITFPDPHLGNKNGRRRLTSGRFLDLYRKILIPGAHLHLKTDDLTLFQFSKESILENSGEILQCTEDLYGSFIHQDEVVNIKTTYEKRYLSEGRTIKYLKFTL